MLLWEKLHYIYEYISIVCMMIVWRGYNENDDDTEMIYI